MLVSRIRCLQRERNTRTMHNTQGRQSKSCKRCLRRKQRCHGFPICTNCEKANQTCQQSEFALELHRHDDNFTALKRIQALEAQLNDTLVELAAVRQDHRKDAQVDRPSTSQTKSNPHQQSSNTNQRNERCYLSSEVLLRPSSRQDDNLDLSFDIEYAVENYAEGTPAVSAGETPRGPVPSGHSDTILEPSKNLAALTLPSLPNLENIVQATVWTKVLPPDFSEKVSYSGVPDTPMQSANPPADELGQRIIQAYFEKIHPRYPFLYRSEIERLHSGRFADHQTSLAKRFEIFKLNMVYAIGATLLQLTESHLELSPESYFMAALQHISAVRQSRALQSIEAMALLVLYNLRSPCSSGIWHMIGLAMRTCIDLNLHREAVYTSATPLENQTKRRLFWTIYSLDRIISLSLRRPFSIAEQDIDTKLPTADNSTDSDADYQTSLFSHNRLNKNPSLALWVRFIQIKRLESRIYSEVYCPNETLHSRFSRVKPLLDSLDGWALCLSVLTESDKTYMQLLASKAILLLLCPFLSMMHPEDLLFLRCLKASGQICNSFKEMHRRDSYSHSFVSAHSTFNAGVTICYCLFRNPHLLSPTVSDSLRACSSTLFVMAERSQRFKKHRDVLEDIINRVMESTEQESTGLRYLDSCQTTLFAERDILAVQSLMELSAQQDPSLCLDLKASEFTSRSFEPVSNVAEIAQEPSVQARYLSNGDPYSLQMLDELMAFETETG